MILPLLLLLQHPTSPATADTAGTDRPVRIWMDAVGPVSRGRGVRLYIQAGSAGNLVVLHSRTDGKIEVLFPARPTDDPHITAGTWEVRGKGDEPIWTVNEPDGNGKILAALSPDPVWFNEFTHEVSWDPDALRPSWSGADPEGGMQDIVQRMLGDGGFTYDVLSYTVAPEAIAQSAGGATGTAQTAQTAQTYQNPDDTFPTYSNIPDEATKVCDGSNPYVYCSYFDAPEVFGRHRHRDFGQQAPSPSLPTPANPQGVASMVLPIHSAPANPGAPPVVPRRRTIPEVGVRTRTPVAPAPTPGAVRTLASHPVTGAELGRLAGAAPAARATLLLPYVHPPRPERPASPAALAPAAVTPPVERAPEVATTVAASMPIRGRGTMLMSRAASPSAQVGVSRSAAPRAAAPSVATRPATSSTAPRTGGTVGAWMVVPRRR